MGERCNPAADAAGGGPDPSSSATPTQPPHGEDERSLLRTIIDAVPDFIHVKDERGRFSVANRAWLAARGFSQLEEIQGKSVFDIFPADVAQRMHEQDERIVSCGEPVIDDEMPVLLFGPDGRPSRRWSVTSKVPMRDEAGRITGIVGISRDITTRRRLERERGLAHAVARVLVDSNDVQDTLPTLIRTICEAMDWVYGGWWTWDRASSNLRRTEWWSEQDPELDDAELPLWVELVTHSRGGIVRQAWFDQHAT